MFKSKTHYTIIIRYFSMRILLTCLLICLMRGDTKCLFDDLLLVQEVTKWVCILFRLWSGCHRHYVHLPDQGSEGTDGPLPLSHAPVRGHAHQLRGHKVGMGWVFLMFSFSSGASFIVCSENKYFNRFLVVPLCGPAHFFIFFLTIQFSLGCIMTIFLDFV